MIIRARTLVTMDGPAIENGAVVIDADRILDVGKFDQIKSDYAGEMLDLGEQSLLPGLINAHCHLDYTCLRGKISRQRSFTDWIRAINAKKSELSPNDYIASINDGFEEAKRFGTTAIANLTAFPELISQVQPPIRTCWFVELIDVRAPERANQRVESAIESLGRTRSPGAPWGFAPHALFTASKHLFRRCEEIARREHILLTTHLAESREEMEVFRDGSGPLYEFIKSIGRPMGDCGDQTPLALFVGALGDHALPHWIVAHLNELTDGDFDLLERSNSKFHIVHCPGSHNYFGHSPFEFERLRSFGFNICLGTDSLASNERLSLFDEMRGFQKKFPTVSAEEIFQMVTVNPARALRQGNALGQIRPGFRADLIAIPCSTSTDIFEQILAFDAPVKFVMVNGQLDREW
jgi:cytosine/adenosine deaminase-related metal-dependent hydrolase